MTMDVAMRILLGVRVAISLASMFAPLVAVTYPSGQSDVVGTFILFLYTLPSTLPHANECLPPLVGVTILMSLLVGAPWLPYLCGCTMIRRHDVGQHRQEASIAVMAAGLALGSFLLGHPFDTTQWYSVLFGLVVLTFSAELIRHRVLAARGNAGAVVPACPHETPQSL